MCVALIASQRLDAQWNIKCVTTKWRFCDGRPFGTHVPLLPKASLVLKNLILSMTRPPPPPTLSTQPLSCRHESELLRSSLWIRGCGPDKYCTRCVQGTTNGFPLPTHLWQGFPPFISQQVYKSNGSLQGSLLLCCSPGHQLICDGAWEGRWVAPTWFLDAWIVWRGRSWWFGSLLCLLGLTRAGRKFLGSNADAIADCLALGYGASCYTNTNAFAAPGVAASNSHSSANSGWGIHM